MQMNARRRITAAVCAIALIGLGAIGVARLQAPNENPDEFGPGITGAMARMTAAMARCSVSDPDRSFAEMMLAHHQGAIDMAVLELRFGSDPTLKRLAQEIIVDQAQEMDVLRLSLKLQPQSGVPLPTTPAKSLSSTAGTASGG